MLKIKDNVDLKELEKYGFTTNTPKIFNKNVLYWYSLIEEIADCLLITKDRELRTFNGTNDIEVLYDLIEANLVEKVKE